MTPQPSVEAPIVKISGVRKSYDSGAPALANVDLDVRAGEFLTLVGPSGCGKSTLLALMAGLTQPSAGLIRWWGGQFAETGGQGRRIGFVFQSPTLMPWASVAANVRLPLTLGGVSREEAQPSVDAALARVHLAPFADRLPRQLSGGMQMRASIARALVVEPDLLLMDEPFGALDEFTRERLDTELLTLWSAQKMTIVFVTHSISEAVFLSTRVAVMAAHPGRILDAWAIDVPYPRREDFRLSPAFARHAQRLSACVKAAGSDALPDAAR